MITPELVSYIKGALAKGQTEVEIKQLLAMGGWNEIDLKEAFDSLHPASAPSSIPQATIASSPAQHTTSPFLKIFGVLLFLGALAYAGWYFFYPKAEVQEENPLPNYSDVEVPDTTPVIVDNNIPLETPIEPTSPIDTIPVETPATETPLPPQSTLGDYEIKILSPALGSKVYIGNTIEIKVQAGKYITGIATVGIGVPPQMTNFSITKHENDVFAVQYKIPPLKEGGFLGDSVIAVSGKYDSQIAANNHPPASEIAKSMKSVRVILDTRLTVGELFVSDGSEQNPESIKVKMGGNYVDGKYVPTVPLVLAILKNTDGTESSAILDSSITTYVISDTSIATVKQIDYTPPGSTVKLKVVDIKGVKIGTTKLLVAYKNVSKSITIEVVQ